ncbi:MAG: hypothetical protein KC583_12740 [Myxococcales bacterium]|nr:hypothetical protein [Myxococcales bacterium]
MTRRRRVRANDLLPRGKRVALNLLLLAIGLGLVLLYKVSVGEDTADFLGRVTGDPELALPDATALDRMGAADAGAPDARIAPDAIP